MNRKPFLLLLLIGMQTSILTKVEAQTNKKENLPTVEENQYKVNIIMPGFGYERGITDKITINVDAGLNPSFYNREIKQSNGDNKNEIFVMGEIALKAEGRYFYNISKRVKKGLNISGNSGDYFAVSTNVSKPLFTLFDQANTKKGNSKNNKMPNEFNYNAGAFWGIQRTYNKFYINLEAGVTYQINKTKNPLQPGLNFNMGYLLFK